MSANAVAVEVPPGIARSKFIPELNAIRGLAILAVLFYHFGSLYTPEHKTLLDHFFQSVCHCGWMGVDLFFVLSGFLITGILLDAKGSQRYFSSFYVRRILRIFPLYYGVLIAVFWLAPALSTLLHRHFESAPSQWSYWLHVSNWLTAFDPKGPLVTNFWTLSVEEQFYLVWPAVIALCPNRWNARLCCCLILGALILRNLPLFLHIQAAHDNFMYRLTPFRIDTLVLGALGAIAVRRQQWPAISGIVRAACFIAGAFILVAVVARQRTVWPGNMAVIRFGYTGVALLCASAVLHAYETHRMNLFGARILRSTTLTRLGEYSYGIYVFHGIVRAYVPRLHLGNPSTRISQLSIMAIGMCAAFVIAIASFYFYEQPFLKLKKRFSY